MNNPLTLAQKFGSVSPAPLHNRVLAALDKDTSQRLLPYLELIDMPIGRVIYEPGVKLAHVYFPITSIVSVLYGLKDGHSTEVSMVGNEGMMGISFFLGCNSTPSRAIVHSAGIGYRLRTQCIKDGFDLQREFLAVVLRVTQSLMIQTSQTAVCNRHHTIDQQMCRWLLLSLDRLSDNHLDMTHELLADILGVRRESITKSVGKLEKLGVIAHSRGKMTVLDRSHLEELSCECYAVIKTATDRLLPPH